MTFVNYRKRAMIGLIATFVSLFVFFYLASVFTAGWLGVILGLILMAIALVALIYAIVNIVRFYRLAKS
jgi:hypothetical protein